jgi:cell division septation protein DedD
VSPDRDDYLEDQAEGGRTGTRSALAAGWLRALLVLAALAVVLMIAVPYVLEWISPSPPPPIARPALTEPAKSGTVTALAPAAPPTKSETVTALAPATPPTKSETETAPAPAAPPATATAPITKPEPAPKDEPAPKVESAAEPAAPAATEPAPARPASKPSPLAARAGEPATPKPGASSRPAATPATAGGEYWVQVGLFANGDNAERLAKELREERFAVEVAQTARGGAAGPVNRHEVVVNGASVETVTAALKGTGTAEVVAGAVVIRPALDLKDAVTLSRRLAGEGLEVRIRRVGAAPAGGNTVYLVRVGGYPTRDAAAAGKRELAAKGVGGFVTQGPAK